MAKSDAAAVVPSYDIETYKANAESLNNGPALVTLLTTSKTLLERGLQSEEDYAAAVKLGNQAGEQAQRHANNFDPLCKGLNSLHKMSTKLREQYTKPWGDLRDRLVAVAKRWYLEAEEAKARAKQDLGRVSQQQQQKVLEEAQDLIDQGYVREGRAKLMEAQVLTAAPVLPDAVPQVEGARVTPKYKGTCTDITAVMAEILAGRLDLMWEVKGEMRPLVAVDQVVLNAIVARLGSSLKCPGINIERDVQIGRG